jgi:hypothetical protein
VIDENGRTARERGSGELICRAVELGALPFPQLMQALIRDDSVLNELNREMGIKTESPGE